MIEETGVVVKVTGDLAVVETRRQGACGSCSANGACGTSLLAAWLGRKPLLLWALNQAAAVPGDTVVVGVQEDGLMLASLAAYLVPLFGLMVGAVAGQSVFPAGGDGASTIGGLAGLVLGLAWSGRFGRAHIRDPRYRAVVLRRLPEFGLAVPFRGLGGDAAASGADRDG